MRQKKVSQKQWVLNRLKEGRALTSMGAFHYAQITRLAAIIHTLRDEGHNVKSKNATTEDGTTYAIYTLER